MLYPGDTKLVTTMSRRSAQTGVLLISRELPHPSLPPFFGEPLGDSALLCLNAFVATLARGEMA
jgi:hypothetical protein